MAMQLLTLGNTKISKGEKIGVLTGVLHLSPYTKAGFGNVCPAATKSCVAACLDTSGRGKFNSVQAGRSRKTELLFKNRDEFLRQLDSDIGAVKRKAAREGFKPAIRLNATSDLNWGKLARQIIEKHSDVQFYDYTKVIGYCTEKRPDNYYITFSYSGENWSHCKKALKSGHNVSVVFNVKKGGSLPKKFKGFEVIDGDVTDARFRDKQNCIVGLRAKGDAINAQSPFIVNV